MSSAKLAEDLQNLLAQVSEANELATEKIASLRSLIFSLREELQSVF